MPTAHQFNNKVDESNSKEATTKVVADSKLQDNNAKTQHSNTDNQIRSDRSFDAIADHFEKKVYGGLKGEIRLAVLRRDIFEYTQQMSTLLGRPLRILDVGAGLAQIAIELAAQGHTLVINDISANMLAKAKLSFETLKDNTETEDFGHISWYVCPYQELADKLAIDNAKNNTNNGAEKFDLILCHALLEWLAEPAAIMDFFDAHVTNTGALSLCFYNPASFDYRNLIMGNFNLLDTLLHTEGNQADNKKSLTPNHPVAKQEVESWLQQHHYKIILESGLRVFHDYSPLKRGGHNDPEAVIRMELRYSNQEPYKRLGRYLHVMATRS